VDHHRDVGDRDGGVVADLQRDDEPARQRIAGLTIAGAQSYEVDRPVRIPGLAHCIVGTR
jgi:hypothetical protein